MAKKDEHEDAILELRGLLGWFIELTDRPEDMYDEEGLPTEELNELVQRSRIAWAKYARKKVAK